MVPPFVVVDVETTGFTPGRDAVIQVAALRVDPDHPAAPEAAHWFVNPARPVPAEVRRLTGFYDVDFTGFPSLDAIRQEIQDFIGSYTVAGHNIHFDLSFLGPAGIHVRNAVDTLEWARIAFPEASSYGLSDLMAAEGFRFHDAREDVRATASLINKIHQQLSQLPLEVRQDLARILGNEWIWWGVDALESDRQSPLYHPAPEPESNEIALPIFHDLPSPETYLGADGPVSRQLDHFEVRPAQSRMSEAVFQNWHQGGILMVEAGTGTGKSLAYLVPAGLESAKAGERVVIATYTVALQEQLWQKDWPSAAVGLPNGATILKGKGRYVCLLKLDEVVNATSPISDDRSWRLGLAQSLVYTAVSERGDVEQWNPRGGDAQRLRESITTDHKACRGPQCVFAGPCFMRQAKRTAESSHVLIVNHALLAAHMAQGGVLPEFQHVIIDEAHHFGEVVERTFGFDLRIADWAEEQREVDHTLLVGLIDENRGGHPELSAGLERVRMELGTAVRLGVEFGRELGPNLEFEEYPVATVRITDAVWQQWIDTNVVAQLRQWTETVGRLLALGRDVMAEADAIWGGAAAETVAWLRYRKWLDDIEGQYGGLNEYGLTHPDWVSWYEGTRRDQEIEVRLRRGPLTVAQIVNDRLWSKVKSAALTSATLSVGGRFEFLAETLGIPAERMHHLLLPSPFDLRTQARLVVPTPLAPVDSVEHQAQRSAFVIDAVGRLGGRTLVLLNSYRALRELSASIRPELTRLNIQTLAQGIDGSGPSLVERFRAQPRAVLLGVSSLWEGVDIIGDALSLVIITRLPFATPGDPIEEARLERIRDQGFSSFYRRTLPQAILKFQQGFGRLIRSRHDRGIVAVLDPRIIPGNTRYGHQFVRAVRPVPLVVNDAQAVLEEIERVVGLNSQ